MALTKADILAARDALVARVGTEFDALAAKLDPAPPVGGDPGIKFAAHKYAWPGTAAPAEFSFYDLQAGPSTHPETFSGERYRYASTARVNDDPGGLTQLLKPALVGDSWLAHSGGKPIARGNQNLLDLGDIGLITAVKTNLPNLLVGYDGLYLDEVDQTYLWGWPLAGAPTEFPTVSQWQAAMLAFVRAIAEGVHQIGKKLWINLGADYSTLNPWQVGLVTAADGVNLEHFVGRQAVGMPPAVGAEWVSPVDFLEDVEGFGKQVHVHASSTTQTTVDYAFASYLLATQFRGSFSASVDYAGAVWTPSSALLASARNLGAPLGVYSISGPGIRSREFVNGRVDVNPAAVSVSGFPAYGTQIHLKA